jgi:hypothetical protein
MVISALSLLAVMQVPATYRGVWMFDTGQPIVVPSVESLWIDTPTRSFEVHRWKATPKGEMAGFWWSNSSLYPSLGARKTAPPAPFQDDWKIDTRNITSLLTPNIPTLPFVDGGDGARNYGRAFWSVVTSSVWSMTLSDSYGSKVVAGNIRYAGGWEKIDTNGTYANGPTVLTLKDSNTRDSVKLDGELKAGGLTFTVSGSRFLSRGTFTVLNSKTGDVEGDGWLVWTPSAEKCKEFANQKWGPSDLLKIRFKVKGVPTFEGFVKRT